MSYRYSAWILFMKESFLPIVVFTLVNLASVVRIQMHYTYRNIQPKRSSMNEMEFTMTKPVKIPQTLQTLLLVQILPIQVMVHLVTST